MKLLLVVGSDDTYDLISLYIKPLGFELIRYRHVIKAMDNVDEVDPTGIIISANDFPRHWKALVQFVRAERPKEACPVIVLKGQDFPLEESSQAFFIGVSGLVDEVLESSDLERLQTIISRYIPVEDRRKARRFFVDDQKNFGVLVSNPLDKTLIPGDIKTISFTGFSFLPVYSASMKDFSLFMEFSGCSLRVGDRILSPVCRLVRTGRIIAMEFVSFPPGEQDFFKKYLEEFPVARLREKRRQIQEEAEQESPPQE
ncbi:MAG: PilZ domain-containing protein [Treponema sp.]|jgi:hypothetical protein|nr:PilZ domain-containing protein [Treponema sp.]